MNNPQKFEKISSVEAGRISSWDGEKLFLTFDIDWAHDDIIRDCVALVEDAGVKATFFITHESPIIDELRGNDLFELGIHPNFNGILNGTDTENNAEKIIMINEKISKTFKKSINSIFILKF